MFSPDGLSSSPSFALPGRGDLIAGRYRVESKLGAGGMGIVVAAFDEQMGMRVAVKLLLPEGPTPPPAFQPHDESGILARSNRHAEMATRLIREASAAARLSSPHVTRVLDVGRVEQGDPYVVMELLEGCDLGRYMKSRGPLPIAEAVAYLAQTCEAIHEAHALGIVHRDLKPSNLFLTRRADGSAFVKVLDFGISKVLGADDSQLTSTTDMLGSPLYMAPEQIRNARDVDGRADVWSLGTILYRLLAGRPAFQAEGSAATLAAIIGDAPLPLRAARPDVPPELEAVLLRCLEKDRSRRIQSVRDLAALLAPFGAAGVPFQGLGSGAHPSLPSFPMLTPSGGVPALTSVAPNAITRSDIWGFGSPSASFAPNPMSGPRARPMTLVAVLLGLVIALVAGGLVAWKLFPSGPSAAAGSGDGPAPAAPPASALAAASQTPAAPPKAASGAPDAPAPAASTEAPAPGDAPAPTASAAASPTISATASPTPPGPIPPRGRAPSRPRPSDDPLGDRL